MSISQTRYVVEHILQIEKVRTTTRKAEERELNSIWLEVSAVNWNTVVASQNDQRIYQISDIFLFGPVSADFALSIHTIYCKLSSLSGNYFPYGPRILTNVEPLQKLMS